MIIQHEVTLIIENVYVEKGSEGGEHEPPTGDYFEYTLCFKVPGCEKKVLVPGEMYEMFHDAVIKEIKEEINDNKRYDR
jgi:hypothetical protein